MHDAWDYDLRKPHSRINIGGRWIRFKKTSTDEGIFYVPTYISPLLERDGWRVRMKLTNPPTDLYFGGSGVPLETSLVKAWRFVVETLLNESLRSPIVRKKKLRDLDTGVTGVRLAWNRGERDKGTILLRVNQSLDYERSFHVTFYSFSEHSFSKEAFDRQYLQAIAARRYYEFLRLNHYRLKKPITPSTDIPSEFYPETLPVPDLFDRMMLALANELKEKADT